MVRGSDIDRSIAKLVGVKMEVAAEVVGKMVSENEHNKYTML